MGWRPASLPCWLALGRRAHWGELWRLLGNVPTGQVFPRGAVSGPLGKGRTKPRSGGSGRPPPCVASSLPPSLLGDHAGQPPECLLCSRGSRVLSDLLGMEAWALMRPARIPVPLGAHGARQDWPWQEWVCWEFLGLLPAGAIVRPHHPVGAGLPWCLPLGPSSTRGPCGVGVHSQGQRHSRRAKSLCQNPQSCCSQEQAVVLGPAVAPALSRPRLGSPPLDGLLHGLLTLRAAGGPFLGAPAHLATGPFSSGSSVASTVKRRYRSFVP